jgi:hypothetical protein
MADLTLDTLKDIQARVAFLENLLRQMLPPSRFPNQVSPETGNDGWVYYRKCVTNNFNVLLTPAGQLAPGNYQVQAVDVNWTIGHPPAPTMTSAHGTGNIAGDGFFIPQTYAYGILFFEGMWNPQFGPTLSGCVLQTADTPFPWTIHTTNLQFTIVNDNNYTDNQGGYTLRFRRVS